MQLEDFANRDGKRVWLSEDELAELIGLTDRPVVRIALSLAGQSGLRRDEIVSLEYQHVLNAPDGFLRVWAGKGDKYRETMVTDRTEEAIKTRAYENDVEDCVIDYDGSTFYRWVRKGAESMQDKTGDPGWSYLSPHDLRRSWGGHLLWNHGVRQPVVMAWGGWENWDTFRDVYLGSMTPEAKQQARDKALTESDQIEVDQEFEPRQRV